MTIKKINLNESFVWDNDVKKVKGIQLISLHKSGSTWVQSYIHKKYRQFGVTFPPSNLYNEFFTFRNKDEMNEPDFVQNSFVQRIKLLEDLRKFGLELAYKAHVPEIIEIWPWFKTFYNEHDILVLKRRDIFTHWLTILFYSCIRKATGPNVNKPNDDGYRYITPSRIERDWDEDIIKSTIQQYKVEFKFDEIVWKKFVNNIRFLNDVVIEELNHPNVLWTEDLTTEWLEDYFKVVLKKLPKPFTTFDIKTYFKPDDMEIIKEVFEERFDNEFQYYGYMYPYNELK